MTTLEWALAYIGQGWKVLPIWSVDAQGRCLCKSAECTPRNIGKHPNGTLAPKGVDSASSNEADARRWFGKGEHNLGIATGKKSNVTVVDVDITEGKQGAATWTALTEGHGEPQTLMAKTGSGGMHVFFVYSPEPKTGNNRLGAHVDVKNDGGYVIAAPSRHRSGGVYSWLNWGTALVVLPAYLSKPVESEEKPKPGRPRKDDLRRETYTLSEVERMLSFISADDQELWIRVGFILGREFKQSDAAWEVYCAWADKWDGPVVTLGTIVKLAMENGWAPYRTRRGWSRSFQWKSDCAAMT